MKIIERATGRTYKGKIEKLNLNDVKKLKNNDQFVFDWSKEARNEVYKLRIKGEDEILGLVSIINIPGEKRIHINLLEASKRNVGREKLFLNIAGILMAYIGRLAFTKRYNGFVSLQPKSALAEVYLKYGFRKVGLFLAIYNIAAI